MTAARIFVLPLVLMGLPPLALPASQSSQTESSGLNVKRDASGKIVMSPSSTPIQDAAKAAAATRATDSSQPVKKIGGLDILTDTQGVDFGPYLQRALSSVRETWYNLIPASAQAKKKGKVAIEFSIMKDGSVAAMKIAASSGDVSMDRAAWAAISAINPFPPLPDEFKGRYLAVRFRFYYNPDKGDLDQSIPSGEQDNSYPKPIVTHAKLIERATNSSPSIHAAQENQNTPSTTTNNTPQTTNAQEPATSVLCHPPTKATTRVDVRVTNETAEHDLLQYVDQSVLPLLRASWYRLASGSGEKVGAQATIQFKLLKDGTVTAVELADGAGHAALGDLALKSVTKSAPFPALPPGFAGQSADVRASFQYTPSSTDNSLTATTGRVGIVGEVYYACSSEETPKGNISCAPPKAVYSPEPEFTAEARRKKTQGVVSLSILVGSDGVVRNACVERALGDGLDESAIEALRQWKFEPGTASGKPVGMKLNIEVDFHLNGKEDGNPGSEMGSASMKIVSDREPAKVSPQSPPAETPSTVCDGKPKRCDIPPAIILPPPAPPFAQDGIDTKNTKYSGTVKLQVTIMADGSVGEIRVVKSLDPGLDQKAIDEVRKWKFEPAIRDGKPVPVQIELEVDFHLH